MPREQDLMGTSFPFLQLVASPLHRHDVPLLLRRAWKPKKPREIGTSLLFVMGIPCTLARGGGGCRPWPSSSSPLRPIRRLPRNLCRAATPGSSWQWRVRYAAPFQQFCPRADPAMGGALSPNPKRSTPDPQFSPRVASRTRQDTPSSRWLAACGFASPTLSTSGVPLPCICLFPTPLSPTIFSFSQYVCMACALS